METLCFHSLSYKLQYQTIFKRQSSVQPFTLCILLKGQIFKIAIKDILVSSICISLNWVMKKNGWHPAPPTDSGLLCSRLIFSSTCSVLSYSLVYLHNYSASTGCAGAARTPELSWLRQRDHTEGQPRLHKEKLSQNELTINKIQESSAPKGLSLEIALIPHPSEWMTLHVVRSTNGSRCECL